MAGFSLFLASAAYYLFRDKTIIKMCLVSGMIVALYSILTYQRNKIWDNEITLWSDVVIGSPHKARPYDIRGIAYARGGELDLAIADYNKAVEIFPSFTEAYFNRGIANAKQGNYSRALTDYSKAIELNPGFSAAYEQRAVIYYQLKDYGKAWDDVRKAKSTGFAPNPELIKRLKQVSQFSTSIVY